MYRHPRLLTYWLLLLALLASPTHAAVITVGQPGDANCDYLILQSAINAAAAAPGLDIVRVSIGTYPTQRLLVNDTGDLAIEGGFVDCANQVRAGTSIFDGQGANPPGPVIQHQGSSRLTLSDLQIRNGVAYGAGSTTTFGGGVSSSGSGDLTVYRSTIYNNRARNGGGMFVSTSFGLTKNVVLDGVAFSGNEAVSSGGGLYALRADLQIKGDNLSYFISNRALGTEANSGGGAMHAVDSSVFVSSRPSPSIAFMESNWSDSKGGAIVFQTVTPGSRTLSIGNGGSGLPVVIAYNTADQLGGAIYVDAVAATGANRANVTLTDAVVSDNQAPQGSAFYLYGSGDGAANEVFLGMAASAVGGGAAHGPESSPLPCPAGLRCNRVEHNVSSQGATIVLQEAGSSGIASYFMERGHLVENIVINSGGLVSGKGRIHIDNSVLANNDAGVSPLISNAGGNLTQVQNSTIANNTRIAPALFALASAFDDLVLHNSIAYQPGRPMLQVAAGAGINLRNLLLGSGHGLSNLASRNLNDNLDPLFVNPGQNNFRLQPGSQARNRWEPGGGVNVPAVDLLGAARPAPPAGPTPYDFGAYEYGAVIDQIFYGPFDNF